MPPQVFMEVSPCTRISHLQQIADHVDVPSTSLIDSNMPIAALQTGQVAWAQALLTSMDLLSKLIRASPLC